MGAVGGGDLRWFQSRTVDAVQVSERGLSVVMDCLLDWFCGLHSIAKCETHRQLAEEAPSWKNGSFRQSEGKGGKKGLLGTGPRNKLGFHQTTLSVDLVYQSGYPKYLALVK